MKTLLHLFTRYRLASSFNLFGLILAFAGCYVLLTQIKFIGSFNHGIKDYENIHRVYIYGIMEEGYLEQHMQPSAGRQPSELPAGGKCRLYAQYRRGPLRQERQRSDFPCLYDER